MSRSTATRSRPSSTRARRRPSCRRRAPRRAASCAWSTRGLRASLAASERLPLSAGSIRPRSRLETSFCHAASPSWRESRLSCSWDWTCSRDTRLTSTWPRTSSSSKARRSRSWEKPKFQRRRRRLCRNRRSPDRPEPPSAKDPELSCLLEMRPRNLLHSPAPEHRHRHSSPQRSLGRRLQGPTSHQLTLRASWPWVPHENRQSRHSRLPRITWTWRPA
ncbi:hypothetical protein HDV57DRAFT_433358 [Trichoderma longibrachiatum]|uniref:Uncharacterized protein n=1 Tax=Trichoderma longibrachiatum ATCC 18648 TaxID=983965 RepID=A0A2T4CFK5_TRILO|nr:hypothetical protein M440DRAFT_190292 [Trichoderma longibrachiatum ATCC 18648]